MALTAWEIEDMRQEMEDWRRESGNERLETGGRRLFSDVISNDFKLEDLLEPDFLW